MWEIEQMFSSQTVAVGLLRSYVYLRQSLRSMRYYLVPQSRWIGIYQPDTGRVRDVTMILWLARLLKINVSDQHNIWCLQRDNIHGTRYMAYHGPLSQAERFWDHRPSAQSLHRYDVVLYYQDQVQDHDLEILDNWRRDQMLYGTSNMDNLHVVFQALDWKCDMVEITHYDPPRIEEHYPSSLRLRDLYRD